MCLKPDIFHCRFVRWSLLWTRGIQLRSGASPIEAIATKDARIRNPSGKRALLEFFVVWVSVGALMGVIRSHPHGRFMI